MSSFKFPYIVQRFTCEEVNSLYLPEILRDGKSHYGTRGAGKGWEGGEKKGKGRVKSREIGRRGVERGGRDIVGDCDGRVEKDVGWMGEGRKLVKAW